MISTPLDFDPNVATAQQSSFITIDDNNWLRIYFDGSTWKTDTYTSGEVATRISADQLLTQEDTINMIETSMSIKEESIMRMFIIHAHVHRILNPEPIEPIPEPEPEPIEEPPDEPIDEPPVEGP